MAEKKKAVEVEEAATVETVKMVRSAPQFPGGLWGRGDGFGKWDIDYDFRFIGRQAIATWETQHSHQGRAPHHEGRRLRRAEGGQGSEAVAHPCRTSPGLAPSPSRARRQGGAAPLAKRAVLVAAQFRRRPGGHRGGQVETAGGGGQRME